MSSFIRDLIKVGVSKIAIIAFGLGQGIIIARWLGPEGNGTLAALTVYPSLFLSFGSLGISQSVTHFIGKKKFSEDIIKRSVIHIWIFTTVISLIVCFFLIRYFSNSGYNFLWVLLAILPIPFTLFNKYNAGFFLGKNQIGTYNRINWLPSAISFISVFVLVVVFNIGVSGALLSLVIGNLFMFFILIKKNKLTHSFSTSINWNIIKSLLSLGLIYALSLLIINLNYKADVILLDKLSNSFNTGIYSKGVSIVDFLWEIPMLLSTIVFARSASSKDDLEFSIKVIRLLRLSIVAIGIASLILIIFAKNIIILLYGNEFVKSALVMQLLLPGVLLLTIFKVLNMDLAGKGKPWISMKAMLPALILNIILNLILLPKYGANGAAIASTISYTFAALLFLTYYIKEVNIPIKKIFLYSQDDFKYVLNLNLYKLK